MSTDYLDMYGENIASQVRKTIEAKVSSMCRRIVEDLEPGSIGTDQYLSEMFSKYGLEYDKEDKA